jgi:hypothetical protein
MQALRTLPLRFSAVLLLAVAGACSDGSDHIIDIDATGEVMVVLYRDDNLNAAFNSNVDQILEGVNIDLRVSGALNTRRGGVTDTAGRRAFNVPVGRYVVVVEDTVLSDSLEVSAGSAPFSVTAGDSVVVPVALSYHEISIGEARVLALGQTAWVRGIVMNSPSVFGDSTVHLVDDSAAIRVTSVRPNLPVLPGDSALFLGRRTVRDGQPVIMQVALPVVRGVINPPPPDSISTAVAAIAGGGSLDARFAKVAGVTVTDTATVNNALTLTVTDGTGQLSVILSANTGWGNPNQYAPDAMLDIRGMLVPDPLLPGDWQLKPRQRTDITILPPVPGPNHTGAGH